MITTNNLHLVPVERMHKKAFLRARSDLAALLQVSVPEGWPRFPEAFALPPNDSPVPERPPPVWGGYFFIHIQDRALVGNGGFTGAPDESGVVEIGYEIAAEHWNRGFATEAAQALIAYVFAHTEIRAVIAHTLAEKNASNSVLQKVGMTFDAEVDEPEFGKIWRWRRWRTDYQLP
jgi:RimJ/RimL family protein N-acetyltransferase